MSNPKVKKGDSILVVDCTSSNAGIAGEIVTVTSLNPQSRIITVATRTGISRSLYTDTDTYTFADRKSRIEHLKNNIQDVEANLIAKKKELEYLEKYASEEEAVAAKLDAILTAHASSDDQKSRIGAMTSILKELKDSHIL